MLCLVECWREFYRTPELLWNLCLPLQPRVRSRTPTPWSWTALLERAGSDPLAQIRRSTLRHSDTYKIITTITTHHAKLQQWFFFPSMYNVIHSSKPQIIYTFNGVSLLDSLHVCPKKTPVLNSREELDLHTHTLSVSLQVCKQNTNTKFKRRIGSPRTHSLSLSKCASKTPILNSREALDLHTHTPGRCRQHDDFGEKERSLDGCKTADHTRNRVTHKDARVDLKLVQDGQQIIGVTMQRGISQDAEILRVGCPCAHHVIQNHTILLH